MTKISLLNSWRIEGETSTWIIAVVCLLFALYLGIQTWIRMNKNRKIALWESFRFLIILLIILTLFNPMRVEELESSEKSQIVCLQDISESMQTNDVIMEDNETTKRSSWTQQFLRQDWIKNLENKTITGEEFNDSKLLQQKTNDEKIEQSYTDKSLKNNMMNEIGKNKIELKKVNLTVLKCLKRFKISVFEYLL